MSTTWGPDAAQSFRAYVLQHAANADTGIKTVADLSRATSIKPSILSKWFSGKEQPSVNSLKRLAPVIKAPLTELLVLACRVDPRDLKMESAPEPPEVLGHPLARELDFLLGADSHLTSAQREHVETFLGHYLEQFRRPTRTRRRPA